MSKMTKSRIFTCCNFLIFLALIIIFSYIFGYLQVYVVQIETEGFKSVSKKKMSSNPLIYIGIIFGIGLIVLGINKIVLENSFNN